MFDEIKRIVAHDTLLAYYKFNIYFDIYMYAINFQLATVMIHNGKTI